MGIPGFVLEHLEFGDVRDVLDTCGIAQASNKMGKIVAKLLGTTLLGGSVRIKRRATTRNDSSPTKRRMTG